MDFIIWLIIAVLWSVANIANQRKKQERMKRRPTAARPLQPSPVPPHRQPQASRPELDEDDDDRDTLEDRLKEFLETLGRPADFEPAPPPRPQPPAAPRPKPQPEPVAARPAPEASPYGRSPLNKPPRRPRTASLQELAKRTSQDFQKATAKRTIADLHTLSTPHSAMIGIKGLNMPLLNVPLTTPHTTHPGAVRVQFDTRTDLKKALAYSIVMGRPKALEDHPEER